MNEVLRRAFFEGYASRQITGFDVVMCMVCSVVIAAYIFAVYRYVNRDSFVNRNFTLSLIAMSVITAAIILTIQSNIVVSLGMVGALSIVRFRTAVKDPLDLVFLFWSISAGIICGAGFTLVAVIASVVVTIVIMVCARIPASKKAGILVVNADDYSVEEKITQAVRDNSTLMKVQARNVTKNSLDITIEVWAKDEGRLIETLVGMEHVLSASIVAHEGDAAL